MTDTENIIQYNVILYNNIFISLHTYLISYYYNAGLYDVVKWLIAKGLDPYAKTKDEHKVTAFDLAQHDQKVCFLFVALLPCLSLPPPLSRSAFKKKIIF